MISIFITIICLIMVIAGIKEGESTSFVLGWFVAFLMALATYLRGSHEIR